MLLRQKKAAGFNPTAKGTKILFTQHIYLKFAHNLRGTAKHAAI